MQNTVRRPKITVSADGKGLVSQAGGLLLAEAARVTGLGQALSGALAPWRAPRAVHDPGKILSDLVMTLALGGDCLADVAVLRAWPELAGPVASDPVISRLVAALAANRAGRWPHAADQDGCGVQERRVGGAALIIQAHGRACPGRWDQQVAA
jgi:hypothetical protein